MIPAVEKTGLWAFGLGAKGGDQEVERKKERLRAALSIFGDRAKNLTGRIAATFPNLTVHDGTHLDALWETADLIAGPDYPLNPMEAFVLGGAILLHDAAYCFEAYEGGQTAVRATNEWRDAMASETADHPTLAKDELEKHADFTAIRLLHARQAEVLAERAWVNAANADKIFLIEDLELRTRYGALIGKIAASHHWNIEDVQSRLRQQVNAPGNWPAEWRVDPIKIACLLRCADAAHIDDRRAPDFLYALLRRSGISAEHWKAQNWLARADLDQSDLKSASIVITSTHAFRVADAAAWWVAFDAVSTLDAEIRASNNLLMSRAQKTSSSPAFAIRRVTGANSPSELSQSIETEGWEPTNAKIHVGNLEHLVDTLGGKNLYGVGGDNFTVVLRELIQNSRDAIVAREALCGSYGGKILVKINRSEDDQTEIEIQDNGIGMSERTMTGPLLDFGTSFWSSDLIKKEFPGLRSSEFRPVGKFGIGFYSTFMIASAATVESRRFDAGVADSVRLLFDNGLTLRPILSRGAKYTDALTVTVVKITVQEPFSKCVERIFKTGQNNEAKIPFHNCIAVISAGLDVAVWVQIEGADAKQAHEPIAKLDTEQKILSWLQDITFSNIPNTPGGNIAKQYVKNNAKRVRPIYDDGKLVGFAALVDTHRMPGSLTTDTVGGLCHNIIRGTGAHMGFMESDTNSAKRDPSKRAASANALKTWANDQVELLRANSDFSLEKRYWIANNLANSEIDPIDVVVVPIAFKNNEFKLLELAEVFTVLENSPIACAKTAVADICETNMGVVVIDGLPTMRPLDAGNIIRLSVEKGRATTDVTLLSCIDRYVASRGRSLNFTVKPTNLRSAFAPIEAFIIKLV